MHQVADRVDQSRHFVLTEHGRQALVMLGEQNGIRQVGPTERLNEQETQRGSSSFDGARRQLAIAEQVNLIVANVVRLNCSGDRRKYLANSSTA
jgi:hypothetical protein